MSDTGPDFTDEDIDRLLRSAARDLWPDSGQREVALRRAMLTDADRLEMDIDIAAANAAISEDASTPDEPVIGSLWFDPTVGSPPPGQATPPVDAGSPSPGQATPPVDAGARHGSIAEPIAVPDHPEVVPTVAERARRYGFVRPLAALVAAAAIVAAGLVAASLLRNDGRLITTDPAEGQPTTVPVSGAEPYRPCEDRFYDVGQVAHQLAFSPDGAGLAVTSIGGTAWLLDAVTGQVIQTFTGHTSGVIGVAFSPDGSMLATAGSEGTARLWDTDSGRELAVIAHENSEPVTAGLFLFRVAFSPDGSTLATTSADGTAQLWDPSTGQNLMTLRGHGSWVIGVAFRPDGEMIATSSADGTVRLWNAATGEHVRTLSGHGKEVGSVAFNPTGDLLVSAGGDGTARVWDPTTGTELQRLTDPVEGSTFSARFSPDGTLILTTGEGDAHLWEATSGQLVQSLEGYGGDVHGGSFTPDGSVLVTVDTGGRILASCSG